MNDDMNHFFYCRDKPPLIPPVIEPIVMPTPMVTSTIDAAKRRQLPAWIREGIFFLKYFPYL